MFQFILRPTKTRHFFVLAIFLVAISFLQGVKLPSMEPGAQISLIFMSVLFMVWVHVAFAISSQHFFYFGILLQLVSAVVITIQVAHQKNDIVMIAAVFATTLELTLMYSAAKGVSDDKLIDYI